MFGSNKKHSSFSDEELMSRSSKGERQAFEMLYERYFDKLLWFVRGFIASKEEAEDLVQEIFIRLIQKPAAFDPRRRFSTWIYTVAGNAARNELRRNKRAPESLDESAAIHVPLDLSSTDGLQREEVLKIFEEFSLKEKQVYVLRFEQDMSLKDISEVLGIAEGSVKSCLFYLLKKLSKHLKHYQYEG